MLNQLIETGYPVMFMDKSKNTFYRALLIPSILTVFLWIIKTLEYILGVEWYVLGIYPRTWEGLAGIITSPFIHGDYFHLISNSVPLLVTGILIFYFYRTVAIRVFLWVFLINGVLVWLLGRPSYHIGISGWVYGLVTFLFFSGLLRKDNRMMAISLLMVFLYGGMIWGVLPVQPGVSWESHLFGALAGVFCAVIYRNEGPQRIPYDWEHDEDEDGLPDQFSDWEKTYSDHQRK